MNKNQKHKALAHAAHAVLVSVFAKGALGDSAPSAERLDAGVEHVSVVLGLCAEGREELPRYVKALLHVASEDPSFRAGIVESARALALRAIEVAS